MKKIFNKYEQIKIKRSRGLKVGDKVKIISGSEKGKISSILNFFKSGIVVKDCNMKYRFINKIDPQSGKATTIRVYKESPIDFSNIMLCNSKGVASKIGWKENEKGEKIRFLKKTGENI